MGLIENRDAQFMLLAGFIIAIGLVITTVLLNSVIFEGNMAIGAGTEPSKIGIINLMEITRDETRSAYRNATKLGGTTENMTANFRNQTQNFSTNLSKIYALHGEGINVSWDVSNWEYTRYADLTENGRQDGTPNWTVVEGVNASLVDIFKLENLNFSGPAFKIEAIDSTGYALWSVEFNNMSNYTVRNITDTSYGSYSAISIDLNSSEYYFKESVSYDPVLIRIINGNNTYGTFKIQGIANNRIFYRERHYILNATAVLYTSRMRANVTIPVSVPW